MNRWEPEAEELQADAEPASDSFYALTPDHILAAIESLGYVTDGRFLALNSYENRVYQVGIEGAEPIVAKFYRPERWSDDCILEEHAYTAELADLEIPVIDPLKFSGKTLHSHNDYRFSVYPRRGGRELELDNAEQLEQIGRLIGRIHAAAAGNSYEHRPNLDIASYVDQPVEFLLANKFIPEYLHEAYQSLIDDLRGTITSAFSQAGDYKALRLHCDCHPGNILITDAGPHIVDFDDARSGPAVQDIWMFLSGERDYQTARLADVLDGYTRFCDFNPAELYLVESLRTMRMIHHSGWLAQRWADPAFPRAFPWFNTQQYWEEHVLSLREQQAILQEPPLVWD